MGIRGAGTARRNFVGYAMQSSDRDDSRYLRNFFPQVAFNSHVESHVAAGATLAGAVKTDLHFAFRSDINEFDIAAISLYRRANEVDYTLNAFSH
jgi:hypothetical protein